ncbi:MAG: ABC transporter permease [Sedimentibacter sp.]|uniref:ABC transporter permease n=1 Tax=Sedimentibacter sp. TaxID=1960295 RepID=UPI00298134A9|nr:ABC transporter permease [Sedimentibacter sp.]MDW5299572.1 ABC transporter permease [Sedimentibacter sp.]
MMNKVINKDTAKENVTKKRSTEIWKRMLRDKSSVASLIFIFLLIIVAIFANVLIDKDLVTAQNVAERIQGPSLAHWFGTDLYGRDIFARVIYGSRVSLSIGIFTVIISTIIGGLLGAIAAYFGGRIDDIIMRISDIFLAIPEQLLAMCVVAAMGATPISVIAALSVAVIPNRCRLVRSTVLSIVDTQYVEAARACGMKDIGIIVKEIMPNTLGPIIVVSTQGIASIMLTASSLSYLGVGIQPPTPEWGAIIFEAREFLRIAPYMCVLPGIVIVLTALAFNLVGDGLRDALDPRLKD